MSALDEVFNTIFDSQASDFRTEFEAWVRASRRYKAFVLAHRTKIRAKLRQVSHADGLADVRAELETAYLLLSDERFTLEYEIYAAAKQGGPDFTVTYKTHTPFNVEVRRLRTADWEADENAHAAKLGAVLCDKVKQMPPHHLNWLWLTMAHPVAAGALEKAAAMLRVLAEIKMEDFFRRRGFKDAGDFLRQYSHMSGVVLWQGGTGGIWLRR